MLGNFKLAALSVSISLVLTGCGVGDLVDEVADAIKDNIEDNRETEGDLPSAIISGIANTNIYVGDEITLDATDSVPGSAPIKSYTWYIDGKQWEGAFSVFTFDEPGLRKLTLVIEDHYGNKVSASLWINVLVKDEDNLPPVAKILGLANGDQVLIDHEFNLSASGSVDVDGEITSYRWESDGIVKLGRDVAFKFMTPGFKEITLTVVDDQGAEHKVSITFEVVAELTSNQAPNAVITGGSSSIVVNQPQLFSAADSSDPDGQIVSYQWLLNGVEIGTQANLSYSFSAAGNYTLSLVVTDDKGSNGVATRELVVGAGATNQAPQAKIVTSATKVEVGQTVTLDGSTSSDPDGDSLSYKWSTGATTPSVTLSFDEPGSQSICLTVSDGKAESTECQTIEVEQTSTVEEGYIYYNGSFINAYAWVANQEPVDQNAAWPGVKMETEGSLKKVKIDSRFDTIIFNAGDMTGDTSQQTTDLSINWSSPCYNGSSWTSVENCSDGGSTNPPPGENPPPGDGFDGQRTAFVHLFEWKWDDIAKECTDFLGPKGVAAVQISPPNEHDMGPIWYTRYRPMSYEFTSRSGNREQFKNMVQTCKEAGVDIYVDAIINHMAPLNYDFPKVPYYGEHFHDCRRDIEGHEYGSSAWAVRNCNLVGLNDLKTESEYVRNKIADYLNDAISMGVTGFRIDAAKHMEPGDIQAILAKLNKTWRGEKPYVFLEVIGAPGEAVKVSDYLGIDAGITEFKYEREAAPHFNNGNIANLKGLENWMELSSDKGVPFVVNHDDNNNGDNRNYTVHLHNSNGEAYYLANIFTLAYPYGYPKVYSGYLAEGHESHPPTSLVHGGSQPACGFNNGPWTCEHRWHGIANMFDFRNHTAKEWRVTNWWDNGHDQIAFGRGGLGFIAITRGGPINQSFSTGMPDGEYCNIIVADFVDGACNPAATTGDAVITVSGGQAHFNVPGDSAAAIHVGARIN